jgi:hypothetical protein
MRIIPFDDNRTKPQSEIDADLLAAKAWRQGHDVTRIDSEGRWMKAGKLIRRVQLPELDPETFKPWPGGKR